MQAVVQAVVQRSAVKCLRCLQAYGMLYCAVLCCTVLCTSWPQKEMQGGVCARSKRRCSLVSRGAALQQGAIGGDGCSGQYAQHIALLHQLQGDLLLLQSLACSGRGSRHSQSAGAMASRRHAQGMTAHMTALTCMAPASTRGKDCALQVTLHPCRHAAGDPQHSMLAAASAHLSWGPSSLAAPSWAPGPAARPPRRWSCTWLPPPCTCPPPQR